MPGRSLKKNAPLFLNHDSPEAVLLKRDAVMTVPESMACVPLSAAEKRIGVLNMSFLVEKAFDNITNAAPHDPERRDRQYSSNDFTQGAT